MKDDTISRAAAIETVRKAKSIGQAHRMLIQLPSAQPGWISVTKRLPKADEEDENGRRKAYLVQQLGWKMHTARYDGEYWILWDGWKVLNNIVAWMPLPERWRGDGK